MKGWAALAAAVYFAMKLIVVVEDYVAQQRNTMLGPSKDGVLMYDSLKDELYVTPWPSTPSTTIPPAKDETGDYDPFHQSNPKQGV